MLPNCNCSVSLFSIIFFRILEQAVKSIFIKVSGSCIAHPNLHLLKHFVDNHPFLFRVRAPSLLPFQITSGLYIVIYFPLLCCVINTCGFCICLESMKNFHRNFIEHIFILIVQHIFCILGCTHIYKFVWIKYIQCSACSAVCPTKEMRKTISIFVAFENKISLIFIYKLVRHVALLGILLGTVCFLSAFTVVNLSGKIYVISCLY